MDSRVGKTLKVKKTWFLPYRKYEGKVGEVIKVVPGASDGIVLRFPDGVELMFSDYELSEKKEG